MDKEKIWKAVLENLRLTISPANFATWFAKTFIVSIRAVDKDRQIAEIGSPSTFVSHNIENRYYGLIKEILDRITEKKNDLVFLVAQQKEDQEEKEAVPLFFAPETDSDYLDAIDKVGLRADFIFENFAVSSTNQMAHAAAQAVTQNPGKAYNPLFLYGGVGVGKTHLMQAIAHAVLKKNPKTRMVYCTSEEFTNEIVEAIRKKTTNEFKQKYRSCKILMVDDIQFIAGKDRAQEEFFHTFNAIWKVGGQIILTSDRRPEEINQLEDRLRSRFEGGLTIDIQPPDFELRTAILLIKAQQRQIKLPMEVAQIIAGNITSTRKLEGMLTRLLNESQTKNISITAELAQALLGGGGSANGAPGMKKIVKPKEMMRGICLYYNLKSSEITGPKRDKPLAVPRQILMYLLRTDLNVSFQDIGRFLGNRDHSTIIHGVDKITKLLSIDEDLRVDIAGIRKQLYG